MSAISINLIGSCIDYHMCRQMLCTGSICSRILIHVLWCAFFRKKLLIMCKYNHIFTSTVTSHVLYRIAENFWGIKLPQLCGYTRKFSLRNLGGGILLHSKSEQSTKVFSSKIIFFTNLWKFSLSKVSCYTVCMSMNAELTSLCSMHWWYDSSLQLPGSACCTIQSLMFHISILALCETWICLKTITLQLSNKLQKDIDHLRE